MKTPAAPAVSPAGRRRATAGRLAFAALLIAALLMPSTAEAQQTGNEGDRVERLAARMMRPGGMGATPRQLVWSPAGDRLAYRWSEGEDDAVWVLDPASGERRRVLDATRFADAEELPPDLDYRWAPDGRALLVLAAGDLYLAPADGGEAAARRLTATEAEEEDPKLSPDGSQVAFVRDDDLWAIDLASGEERPLTRGGEEGVTLNGTTDWVYWEELYSREGTGFWWSPDGTRIAYYRFDETPVGRYPLVDFTTAYPEIRWQRYPKAGTANPRVEIGVLDLAAGTTTWLDTGDDDTVYLARVHWRPDGERLAVERVNREQDRLDLLLCDPAGGGCETLLTETWPTWINIEDHFAFLPDGGFVWGSERSGWRHLYLYDAGGGLVRQLTAGDWAIDELAAVDASAGRAVVTAFGEGPLGAAERRVLAVGLGADGGVEELAAEPGWNGATAAPAGGLWVHSWSDANTPERVTVRDAAGEAVAELPIKPPEVDPAELPQIRIFTLPGRDGTPLPASLMEPAGLDPAGSYPAIMYHYGGPGSQVVANRWGRRDAWHKLMAYSGYAVLAVDNPASAFFGKRGEDRQHRRFGPLNLEAQLSGVDYLAGLGWVDTGRIGLWGWSGGGANTLYCVLNSPGTWRAAVAGAPVTDWHLYDTIWTERYLDHPDDNAEGYEQSSSITYADQLADALLVVHGTGDDNVHPQNTLNLSGRLIAAGKPFEQAIYPGEKHGFRGPAMAHFFRRMTEFFRRELAMPAAESEEEAAAPAEAAAR